MKKRTKIFIYCAAFAVAFLVSAVVRIAMLGSAPERLIQVEWNDSAGTVYKDLPYENDSGHGYDLYIPAGLRSTEDQHLILLIHGGSFNSGAKEDGDAWCKFYASKGIYHRNRRLHFADTRTGCVYLSDESGNRSCCQGR